MGYYSIFVPKMKYVILKKDFATKCCFFSLRQVFAGLFHRLFHRDGNRDGDGNGNCDGDRFFSCFCERRFLNVSCSELAW